MQREARATEEARAPRGLGRVADFLLYPVPVNVELRLNISAPSFTGSSFCLKLALLVGDIAVFVAELAPMAGITALVEIGLASTPRPVRFSELSQIDSALRCTSIIFRSCSLGQLPNPTDGTDAAELCRASFILDFCRPAVICFLPDCSYN